MERAKTAGLMSSEHFTVDGTLSVAQELPAARREPEDRPPVAKHVLMENRSGLITDLCVTEANGRAEIEAALIMLERDESAAARRTVGADKGYDTREFVERCRELGVTPHVAMNTKRRGNSAIDGRTSRHPGYSISQRIRKRVEEIFGWEKTVGGFRKTRLKGRKRTEMAALLLGASYNLLRMARLMLGAS